MTVRDVSASPDTPATELSLGVDIGTSSSKGVLVDHGTGTILATAVRSHRVDNPRPGWFEMEAEVWWREFVEITTELLAEAALRSPGSAVTSVGVSGMGPCVLLADAQDVPVRPAILYGVDTRASVQVNRMTQELGNERIVGVGGSRLSSQAAGPKILWVRDNEPQAFARARRLYMPATYLIRRLTGRYLLDHQSASQCSPLYDVQAAAWDEELWSAYAAPLAPPELAWAEDVIGAVGADAARQTGLAAGTPVTAGTIDAWSEAVSVDAHNTGDLMLMYGSTMFLVATQAQVLRDPSMWTTAGVFEGSTNLAGGLATSGVLTQWVAELTGLSFAELSPQAVAAGAGADGLLMLPYFSGERTPIQDPDARGVLVGLTLSHGAGHLYRAALEATAFAVRHNIETMRAAGARIDRVVAVGGGTQGRLWLQIVSDVTGLDQHVPQTTVGAAYGSAYLAARALTQTGTSASGSAGEASHEAAVGPEIGRWNPVAEVIRPDPALAEFYDRRYQLYRRLYRDTREVAHALATEQQSEHPTSASDDTTRGERP